ncbi:hypothetical protein ACIQCF_33030 [Streptomyces sp. NPDC088353]|uniref:hypothetical protein n=1 Tax=Streptomyces sp. NPDC088353 TaxID=3365855 RepID=UPI0037F88F43
MRKRIITVIAAASLALTACSSAGSDSKAVADDKPAATKPAPTQSPTVDCSDTSLDQATWMAHCSEQAGTGGDGTADAQDLEWGKPATTTGAQLVADDGPGGGALEVTPTTVVYAKTAMGNTAANGVYAIIAVKDRATGTIAAAESRGLDGGGWQWIAPDGQALDEGENDASSITPDGFTGGGMIKAGTYHWNTIAFDLTEAQRRGGTIAYTDGAGATFRWKVPASDGGPELAALKKGMEGNY